MVNIAVQQNDNSGCPATFGEYVSDKQHGAAPATDGRA
jgi:hypothetical protein